MSAHLTLVPDIQDAKPSTRDSHLIESLSDLHPTALPTDSSYFPARVHPLHNNASPLSLHIRVAREVIQ